MSKKQQRYRRVAARMTRSKDFRSLSPVLPSGQSLWIWLLIGDSNRVIPGIIFGGKAGMAEDCGWSVKDFVCCLDEIEAKGMAVADLEERLIYLPKGIENFPPDSSKSVAGWRGTWEQLQDCPLKDRIARDFIAYFKREHMDKSLDAFLSFAHAPSDTPLDTPCDGASDTPCHAPPDARKQDTGSRIQEAGESSRTREAAPAKEQKKKEQNQEPEFSDAVETCYSYAVTCLAEGGHKRHLPKTAKKVRDAKDILRQMIEQDEIAPERILEAWQFIRQDTGDENWIGWRPNIGCIATFREKWVKVNAEALRWMKNRRPSLQGESKPIPPAKEPDPPPEFTAEEWQAGESVWKSALETLEANINEESYNTWIAQAIALGEREGVLHLSIYSAFARGFLWDFKDELEQASGCKVEIHVVEPVEEKGEEADDGLPY